MSAAVDDLNVVKTDDWDPKCFPNEITEALEVADDDLRTKLREHVKVRASVRWPAFDSAGEILKDGPNFTDPIAAIVEGESPNSMNVGKIARQIFPGSAGNDHMHFVLARQLFKNHPRPSGVAHPLPHHAIENSHSVRLALSSAQGEVPWPNLSTRLWAGMPRYNAVMNQSGTL
jgi:hypothetical protein